MPEKVMQRFGIAVDALVESLKGDRQ
jgi:hypothetical protein